MKKKRKRHFREQIVKKLRDVDVMLNTGKSLEEVLKVLEASEATLARWRSQYCGMKSEEAREIRQYQVLCFDTIFKTGPRRSPKTGAKIKYTARCTVSFRQACLNF
jgi:hypothetical protein